MIHWGFLFFPINVGSITQKPRNLTQPLLEIYHSSELVPVLTLAEGLGLLLQKQGNRIGEEAGSGPVQIGSGSTQSVSSQLPREQADVSKSQPCSTIGFDRNWRLDRQFLSQLVPEVDPTSVALNKLHCILRLVQLWHLRGIHCFCDDR